VEGLYKEHAGVLEPVGKVKHPWVTIQITPRRTAGGSIHLYPNRKKVESRKREWGLTTRPRP